MQSPYPLGANPEINNSESGYRFVVRSPQASQVTLCLFDDQDKEKKYVMQADGEQWHIWLAGISHGQRYGFRADGKSTLQQPFNANKLLLDPYTKSVIGKPQLASDDDCAFFLMTDERDNASVAPKSQIIDEAFDWEEDTFPQTPWSQTIIYELHVKGFTQLSPELPIEIRGSYAGLAEPATIDYLTQLGITTVELMPIAFGIDEPQLQAKELNNYWNYNTLAPFSVESNYWSGRSGTTPLSEFKNAVKALHEADIEVILDVVFNHTAEAEHNHPTYCQRGLVNADFYWLNDEGSCFNHTGCGNTINASNPHTQQWIIDCLIYWVEMCHVDGFRFDLGSVLGRTPDFQRDAPLLRILAEEPLLQGIKFIFEPWDIGAFGYQLGNFSKPFAEWNDRFRDDMREFFVYQNGNLGSFAERFAGSSDVFKRDERQPHSSINLITAHDGFSLADVVSYNDKHNHDNGEDNRDGHSHNLSDNHGIEGHTENEAIISARRHTQRALLSALLLANGTPMLLAGDEIGLSQRGNNNAYCQDNAIAWFDWENIDKETLSFTRELIQCRKRIPSLNNNQWWERGNVEWLNTKAEPMQVCDWSQHESKALQIRLDDDFLLLINGKREKQAFNLPIGSWKDLQDKTTYKAKIVIEHLAIIILVTTHKGASNA